ncbi:ankyrin repeat domain-containing protein [Aspergillus fumigatus Af293]|uniref:Ankyrin repeat protein n=2 Tax=Aspergillus fumigatus TaxID=746128 RepID=B0Y0J0_ASPFC|nr:hypothetical protein AFUB_046370 [Aspergillus fumigatus A1163]
MAHGGQTSLHAATSANPIKTVSLLIKHGGNVNVIDPWPESALHLSLSDWIEAEIWKITPSQTKMVKRRNTIRLTPLTYAARNHHLQVVLLLLRHTEGVDFADESLRPAVTSAVAFSDVVFLELVIEKGKLSDSIRTNAMDETPQHCAAINGSRSAVRLLLEKGVNVELHDKSALVPLLLEASKGHTAVVCLLLEYSASIDPTNADGDTALMIAVHNGHHETILSLLARSVAIDCVNHAHRTALSRAAENDHDKIVEILLQYGTEVDLPNHTGQTPLTLSDTNKK